LDYLVSTSCVDHRIKLSTRAPPMLGGLFKANAVFEEEEEEEESLFKADAVNEDDPERDRATQV
jgi:hypothetical protein